MNNFTGTLIDVRSPEEFNLGHVQDSINIPLQDISDHIEAIKKMKTPILFFCASGIRSEHATNFFKAQGIDCLNGGGWRDVLRKINEQ